MNDFNASEWVVWLESLLGTVKVGGLWATQPDYASAFVIKRVSERELKVISGVLDDRTAAVIDASDYVLVPHG